MAGLNTSVMFPEGIIRLNNGGIDFDLATAGNKIRLVLLKKSFPNTTLTETNKDAFDFLDDIPSADRSKNSAFPVLGTQNITKSNTADKIFFASDTVSVAFTLVTNATSCRGVVAFKSVSGTESACPIVSYNHFAANVTADGGTVTVTLHANGLFQASYV